MYMQELVFEERKAILLSLSLSLSPDLMPGKVFSEQIADMIKSGCRKTIILLSPDYLESEWCSYEARMALHESPGYFQRVVLIVWNGEGEWSQRVWGAVSRFQSGGM